MFEYFEKKKKEKAIQLAKQEFLAKRPQISAVADVFDEMSNWPRQRLMDARDKEYELLEKLHALVNWEVLISKEENEELKSFVNQQKHVASWIDDDWCWHNPSTDEVRTYDYPPEGMEIFNEQVGETPIGDFKRVSADYYVKDSLKEWSKRIRKYLEEIV